ncbi:MAG: sugar phosphate isomerase/epimerase [Holosporaceae bacterium]|jgi:hypothetical protein|nr:sugar phosphate isomerase/epimerase [Holosporaceae bacterium]
MLNFKISLPFLSFVREQIPFREKLLGNQCTEAIMFNAQDLFGSHWEMTWKNIAEATYYFSPSNVTFHFPVNNSNYCDDRVILDKLKESYQRACDLGLAGIVVHSNCIRDIGDWSEVSLPDLRKRVADTLHQVKNSVENSQNTWLSLENMIIMDNFGKEIDPLFLYADDFQVLDESIGVVLDLCHFFYTVTVSHMLLDGRLDKKHYPNVRPCAYGDIKKFKSIRHCHFAAFRGIAIPFTEQHCREGMLPEEGDIDENLYYEALSYLNKKFSGHLVLEIQEDDYAIKSRSRLLIKKINEL